MHKLYTFSAQQFQLIWTHCSQFVGTLPTLDLSNLLCTCSMHEVEQLAELDDLWKPLPNLSYSMTLYLVIIV